MLKKLKALKLLFSKPAEICRSLKTRLFRREVKQSLMFKLDKQVLHRIFDMLDPVDQACLAFTCSKYLYLLWKVQDITLWGPDTEKHAICPTAVESSKYTTRERFSCRLQNKQWLFCAMCRRLHPERACKSQEYERELEYERQQRQQRQREYEKEREERRKKQQKRQEAHDRHRSTSFDSYVYDTGLWMCL